MKKFNKFIQLFTSLLTARSMQLTQLVRHYTKTIGMAAFCQEKSLLSYFQISYCTLEMIHIQVALRTFKQLHIVHLKWFTYKLSNVLLNNFAGCSASPEYEYVTFVLPVILFSMKTNMFFYFARKHYEWQNICVSFQFSCSW